MAESEKERLVVVCVEDEPEMIDLIKLILGRRNFKLIGAVGGREGLETIREKKPELVLLDLMMPDMDGWEVYQRMKADPELQDIPVIVVTAKAQSIDKVLGLHIAKVDDYVTKAFWPSRTAGQCEQSAGAFSRLKTKNLQSPYLPREQRYTKGFWSSFYAVNREEFHREE